MKYSENTSFANMLDAKYGMRGVPARKEWERGYMAFKKSVFAQEKRRKK
ncbi:MAG: hypothetical protein ACM3U1_05700 [Chloroflexota bacterium]